MKVTSSTNYFKKKDQEITIYYNKKYPVLISADGDTNTWGYILIFISFFLVVIPYLLLLKAKRFQEFYNSRS